MYMLKALILFSWSIIALQLYNWVVHSDALRNFLKFHFFQNYVAIV